MSEARIPFAGEVTDDPVAPRSETSAGAWASSKWDQLELTLIRPCVEGGDIRAPVRRTAVFLVFAIYAGWVAPAWGQTALPSPNAAPSATSTPNPSSTPIETNKTDQGSGKQENAASPVQRGPYELPETDPDGNPRG